MLDRTAELWALSRGARTSGGGRGCAMARFVLPCTCPIPSCISISALSVAQSEQPHTYEYHDNNRGSVEGEQQIQLELQRYVQCLKQNQPGRKKVQTDRGNEFNGGIDYFEIFSNEELTYIHDLKFEFLMGATSCVKEILQIENALKRARNDSAIVSKARAGSKRLTGTTAEAIILSENSSAPFVATRAPVVSQAEAAAAAAEEISILLVKMKRQKDELEKLEQILNDFSAAEAFTCIRYIYRSKYVKALSAANAVISKISSGVADNTVDGTGTNVVDSVYSNMATKGGTDISNATATWAKKLSVSASTIKAAATAAAAEVMLDVSVDAIGRAVAFSGGIGEAQAHRHGILRCLYASVQEVAGQLRKRETDILNIQLECRRYFSSAAATSLLYGGIVEGSLSGNSKGRAKRPVAPAAAAAAAAAAAQEAIQQQKQFRQRWKEGYLPGEGQTYGIRRRRGESAFHNFSDEGFDGTHGKIQTSAATMTTAVNPDATAEGRVLEVSPAVEGVVEDSRSAYIYEEQQLLLDLTNDMDVVVSIQEKLYEIINIMDMFTYKITQQNEMCDYIHTLADTSANNMSTGNKHLSKALERSTTTNRYYVWGFVVAGFILLLFDYIKSSKPYIY